MASEKHPRSDPFADAQSLSGELFGQFPVGLAVFSADGRFLRANPALCRMLGYSEQELAQKNHLDVVHADDREAAALLRAQAVSGRAKPRLNERRYVRKDGATVWAQLAGAVQRDATGAAVCTAAIISDITSLKRAARASEQRFRRMVEMGSDWCWMQDAEFRFVEVPGLEPPDVDTDVAIGKARWEITGLAPMQESWEQHRVRLRRHESFSDFVLLRYKTSGELPTSASVASPYSTSRAGCGAITASAGTSPSARAIRRLWRRVKNATGCCSRCTRSRCGWWTRIPSPLSPLMVRRLPCTAIPRRNSLP